MKKERFPKNWMKNEKLPENWWKEKLIEAFEHFWGKASNAELKKYFLEKYSKKIFESVKESSLNWSINWQLQYFTKKDWWNLYRNKEDLFYNIKRWIWWLNKNYKKELEKNILQASDLNITEAKRKQTTTNRIIRDTKIIIKLKKIYNNCCQICWKQIKISNNLFYSEWHHIKPLGKNHNWPDIEDNVIILCPNHHAEFDYWIIAIEPISNTIISKNYNTNDLKLNILHIIDNEFLDYHLKEIYKV